MLYVSKVDGQDFFSLSKRNRVLLADVKDLFVAIWIKDVLIILGFFLLVFSLWIPPVVFEMMSATALSFFFAPSIKRRLTSLVGKN